MQNRGLSVVETMVALAIFSFIVVAGYDMYRVARVVVYEDTESAQAWWLAYSGLEAVEAVRDTDLTNITDGAWGVSSSSGSLQLVTSNDQTDIFTRTITIATVDADTKSASSTVTWNSKIGLERSRSVVRYFTDWQAEVVLGIDWSNPTTTAEINLAGSNNGLKTQTVGDFLYVIRSGGSNDFVVFDISSPDNPTVVGELTLDGNPRNIFVQGDFAYVVGTDNSEELQIIDISDSDDPALVGTLNVPGNSNGVGVYVVGNRAYLTISGGNEFVIADVTIKSAPIALHAGSLPNRPEEIYVSGSHAYVASRHNSQEVQVIDVSNPFVPTIVDTLNLDTNSNALTITGDGSTLLVGRANGLVHTVNITTPTNLSVLDTYDADNVVRDIALGASDTLAFIVGDDNDFELQIIDISTPVAITVEGLFSRPGNDDFNGVAYSSEYDRAYAVSDDNDAELVIISPD